MKQLPLTLLMLLVIPACSLSSGACGSGIEPAPPSETPESAPAVEAEAEAEAEPEGLTTKEGYDGLGPYECEDDGDCTNTCGGGAMNHRWFQAHIDQVPKCKDGCAGKGVGKPRCVDGGCVAMESDGTVDEPCTRKLEKTY